MGGHFAGEPELVKMTFNTRITRFVIWISGFFRHSSFVISRQRSVHERLASLRAPALPYALQPARWSESDSRPGPEGQSGGNERSGHHRSREFIRGARV